MRVLITGGCGFIGSHVAERLYKCGNEITIIDNLSTGRQENIAFKCPLYRIDVSDAGCEEVFRECMPEAVIHLAAQADVKTSMEEPYLDARSNILGLVNMLELSRKYGVKRFIFASSAAVYGNTGELPLTESLPVNPMSPYGISKSVGEIYCSKWNEIFSLNTLALRLSNVYGPRQGMTGEGGVISVFVQRMLKGQQLTVFGDGEQTRDFIYVDDVAQAICLCLEKSICGVYNLSTNTSSSINELIEIIGSFHPVGSVSYVHAREGDIRHSRLDNSRIIADLGWKPEYDLKKGIEETLRWFSDQ